MEYSQGEYEIDSKGEIIIIRFLGIWDKGSSEKFIEDYIPFVKNKRLNRFGVLADLQDFEGATPDAAGPLIKLSLWGSKNGQVARAQIINTELKYFTVKDLQNLNFGYPIKDFDDIDSAFQWLNEQGLKTSDF